LQKRSSKLAIEKHLQYSPDVAFFGIKMKSLDFDENQCKLSKVSGDSYNTLPVGRDYPSPL
jgi:hypothetical protein